MVGWIALAAIVVVILGGGIFAKQEITSYWPEAESLYMLLGLEADMPGAGLLLRNVTSARGEDDGIATLVVRGEVVNISDEIQDVPGLRAILRDANENDIQQWSVAAQERRLLPGESTSFESSLKNPPEDAARLSITFAAEP